MTGIADPLLLQTLETLALAEWQLGDAVDRLASIAPTVRRLTDDTDWNTPTAVRFHAAAQLWQSDVLAFSTLTVLARADVRRLADRVGTLAWGYHGA